MTLDFEVELSQETLDKVSQAVDDLNADDQEQLIRCKQQVIDTLLADWRDELEAWSRNYIVERLANGDFDIWPAAEWMALPEMLDEYDVVEEISEQLPPESIDFLEKMSRDKFFFEDFTQDVLFAFQVRLMGASLQHTDKGGTSPQR